MNRFPRVMAVAVMLLAMSTGMSKAENVYDVVWDGTITRSFFVHPIFPYYLDQQFLGTVDAAGTSTLGMTLPALNVDFSTDKTFRISLSAPAGKAIRIAAPVAAGGITPSTNQFQVNVSSFTSVPGAMIAGTVDSFVFTGLQGPAPTVASSSFDYGSASLYPGQDPQFSEAVAFNLTDDPLVFTSLTMTFTAPSAMTFARNGFPVAQIVASSSGFFDHSSDPPADPGVWVSLVAVPEIDPNACGAALAIVLGALGLAERRVRRVLGG